MIKFKPCFWNAIRLVVFDVDGTLYNQLYLRAYILRDLLLHSIINLDFSTALILKKFREKRDNFIVDNHRESLNFCIYENISQTTKYQQQKIEEIRKEWIDNRPLRYLKRCKYKGIDHLLNALQRNNIRTAVFSDYPAREKLNALNLYVDDIASAEDPDINVLKPNPKGLITLMNRASVRPEETLLIGDRLEKDGLAADKAGTHCLLRCHRNLSSYYTFTTYFDNIFKQIIEQ